MQDRFQPVDSQTEQSEQVPAVKKMHKKYREKKEYTVSDRVSTDFLVVCLTLGLILGAVLGFLLDAVVYCVAGGLVLGMVIGLLLDRRRDVAKQRNNAKTQEQQE